MAEITASLVKELREKTGAGMMDCKTALSETQGDLEKAIDWLRTKGLSAAAKKAGRVAAEGLVGVAASGDRGAIIEVNAETDFVGRNETFQKFVAAAARIALDSGGDMTRIAAAPFPGTGRDVAGRADQPDRHDRREHEPAPCRRALGVRRRRGLLRAQHGGARSRQDRRAGGARIDRRQGQARGAGQAARHARRGGQPAVAHRRRSRQGGDRARARGADREGRPERQDRRHRRARWSKAACASSTRRWCCWSSSS